MARVRDDAKYELQRTRILDEAVRIFHAKGYENSTMEDVAVALKVTKAAVYYYFPRKTDLLLAICEAAMDLAMEALDPSAVKDESADVRLRHIVTNLIKVLSENTEEFTVFYQEVSIRPEPQYRAINAKRRKFADSLESVINSGMREGTFRKVDSRLMTMAIVGMCQWTYIWFRSEQYSIDQVTTTFMDFIERALEA